MVFKQPMRRQYQVPPRQQDPITLVKIRFRIIHVLENLGGQYAVIARDVRRKFRISAIFEIEVPAPS